MKDAITTLEKDKVVDVFYNRIWRIQYLKILYSKALTLAHVGAEQDDLVTDYRAQGKPKGFGLVHLHKIPIPKGKIEMRTRTKRRTRRR